VDGATELFEIEAIKKLMARRVRALDTKDWVTYRQLHADDHMSYGFDDKHPRNADEMIVALKKMVTHVTTFHMVHSPDIILTSADTAVGHWYLEDRLWWKQGEEEHWLRGYGRYEDTHGKRNGEWKFTSRRLHRVRIDVSPGGVSPIG
jgi:hypothetical protein